MADSNKLLLLGAAGAAVWYFYFRTPAAVVITPGGWRPPAGGTPAGSAPPADSTPPAGTGASTPPAPAVSTIQARVLAAAGDPAGGLNVDEWGWYLNNELSAAGLPAAPDPMPLLQAVTGSSDRSQKFNFGQYWGIISPALRAAPYGLAGYGLAGFGLYLGTR